MRKTLLILILVNIVAYKVQTSSKYNNTVENTSDPMSSKPLKKKKKRIIKTNDGRNLCIFISPSQHTNIR